ncbi:MAG: PEP-CTERM sorting domain-containing protein [Planctomycetales bacterium]|nr:PEP-CTERM sorting domain-containing protein [Planctomycetales bacterium]
MNYASNVSADGAGWTVSDGTGATPDIALFWGSGGTTAQGWDWEAHNAATFEHIEALHAGGAWDAVAPPSTNAVAQTQGHADGGALEIQFLPAAAAAVVVNSFDIGNAYDQVAADGVYGFHIELLDDSDDSVVWSHDTGMWGVGTSGREESVAVGYTGALGQSYTLTFARLTDPNDPGNGFVYRGAIDNLSFSQTPEPSALALLTIMGLGVVRGRRR